LTLADNPASVRPLCNRRCGSVLEYASGSNARISATMKGRSLASGEIAVPDTHAVPFALALPALAAVLVSLFLLLGSETVVLSLLNDDAYYYFQIARNTLHGNGPSFDGISPTNGFHPLYYVLLLPVFASTGSNNILPMRLALVLLAVAYFATSYTIYGCVKHLAGRQAGIWAALAWAFHPLFIFFARGGVEAPIYALCASLFFFYYVSRLRETPTAPRAAMAGLLAGLTVLARTDGLLVVAAVAADFLLVGFRQRQRLAQLPQLSLAALLPALIVISPWVLWNLHVFGTVVQTSAQAHRFTDHAWRSVPGAFATLLRAESGPRIWVAAAVAAAAAGLAIRVIGELRRVLVERLGRVLFLLGYLGAFFTLVFGIYGWFRNWYFLAPGMATLILLSVVLLAVDHASARARRWGASLFALSWAGLAAAGTIQFIDRLSPESMSIRAGIMHDVQWVAEHIDQDAVIGAFNAGRYGYFLPQRVINLDGVVNNAVLETFPTRTLDHYVAAHGIRYILDKSGFVDAYFERYAAGGKQSLTLLQRLREADLYRVELAPGSPPGGSPSTRS
jgi:4-amino-4-deoxy-L-arabinose transferase-like glycosyltransferase